MRRYEAYRDSGNDWLGDVPASWERKKLKYWVDLVNDDPTPSQAGFQVALENIEGWTGRFIETQSTYGGVGNGFCRGDVLFNKLRPYLAKVFHAPMDGATVGELLVLRPDDDLDGRFLFYRLASSGFIDVVNGSTYGAKMPRASWDFIGNLRLPLPPLLEQRAIAAYLDRKTQEIDTLVEKKRALIALLQEQRTALINRAVTKGLDPGVPMKDSGIEWLGEVPAHWKVSRLKWMLSNIEQGWSPQCESRLAENDEWGVLKVGCVNGTYFDEAQHKALPISLEPRKDLEVSPGDLLMSRANTRELVGSVAIIRAVRPQLMLCDKLYKLSLTDELHPVFAEAVLSAVQTRRQIEEATSGASSSMQNISQVVVQDLIIAVPPHREQRAIADYLDHKTAEIDEIIDKETRAIDLLQELRTSLISEVVTGKIDVRDEVPA